MTGSTRQIVIASIGFIVVCAAGTIILDWRKGLYVFLIWLLAEDIVRKYMGNDMTIYFVKDILAAIVYLAFLRSVESRTKILPASLKYALGLFVLLGVVQVFNPNSPSLVYGLLGIKLYLYYIPLMFVGYALLRTEADLRRFLFVNLGVSIPIAVIGIIQSVAGLDFLNPKVGGEIDELGHLTRYTPSGLAVPRPPSVFVSDGRFAQYTLLIFILGIGTAGYLLLRGRRGGKLVLPAVGVVGLAAVMSGGRGCFSYVAISSLLLPVGFLWGAPPRAAETYRLLKAIRRTVIVVALALTVGIILFPQEVGAHLAFYRETVALDSPDSETFYRAWDYPVANFLGAFADGEWILGHGIGTASLGLQYVSRFLGQTAPQITVENGYGTLIIELGIGGLFLWLTWTLTFVISAVHVVLRLRGKPTFTIALAILWFGFLLLFPFTWGGMVVYQNFVMNANFWLLAGMLFRLPTLQADDSAMQSGL